MEAGLINLEAAFIHSLIHSNNKHSSSLCNMLGTMLHVMDTEKNTVSADVIGEGESNVKHCRESDTRNPYCRYTEKGIQTHLQHMYTRKGGQLFPETSERTPWRWYCFPSWGKGYLLMAGESMNIWWLFHGL